MDKNKLQKYIEENIPVVKEMGFKIDSIEKDTVTVVGNYCKHINHTKSVFGGSISSIMTLAGWSRVKVLSEDIDKTATIVIKNNYTNFIKPVTKDYKVTTLKVEEKDIEKLKKTYKKFGKGRILVGGVLTHKDSSEVLAEFKGEYVLLR